VKLRQEQHHHDDDEGRDLGLKAFLSLSFLSPTSPGNNNYSLNLQPILFFV
jgi:hypothetical protein